MNDPLFKNAFVRGEDTAKELFKNYFLGSKRFKILYILFALLLVLSFFVSADTGYDTFLFSLFCGVIVAIILSIAYRKNVKVTVERDRERCNGKEPYNELFVYDDRIELDILGNNQTLYFTDAKQVSLSKNYIFVHSKANYVYSFKKDSFTLGSAEEFIEFLKSKGIKEQK